MGALIRLLATVLVLACAGCIYDPGFYGGPGGSYPGGGYPTYPDYPGYPDYPDSGYGGQGGPFRCESRDERTQRCPADTRGGVRLVRQLSSTSCIQGQTWGYDRGGIWVSRGCRAEFVTGQGGGGHRPDPGPGQIVRCESRDGRQRRCNVSIQHQATLVRQLSNSPCIRGTSWGWDRNGIWVGSGCRADFSVR